MSYIDLESTLDEWHYEPERISVRKIVGLDGSVKIQMRVELGILQMHVIGRPDGAKPHGFDSLLAHHHHRLRQYEQRNGTTLGFSLNKKECYDLRLEASLYYRRFVALFVMEEYGPVADDTSHSLAIFDLCREYALDKDDRLCLEEFRPYVVMMDARARAYQALGDGEIASALAHVNRGMMAIKAYLEQVSQGKAAQCEELKVLRALSNELSKQIPKDSLIVTRKALRTAIEEERFEEAARLRDALKTHYHRRR